MNNKNLNDYGKIEKRNIFVTGGAGFIRSNFVNYLVNKYKKDRIGYDVNFSYIKNNLGWEPTTDFDKAIQITGDWYLSNLNWLEPLIPPSSFEVIKKRYR